MNKKLKIMVMPGHYEASPGAVNTKYNLKEYDIVRSISEQVCARLKDNEYIKPMSMYNADLHKKKDFVDLFKPDVIVENHMNWSALSKSQGTMTIYEEGNFPSRHLAEMIEDSMKQILLMKSYGTFSHAEVKGWRKWKNFFLFDRIEYTADMPFGKFIDVPTVLTEIGFLSNENLCKAIKASTDFIDRAATSLAVTLNAFAKYRLSMDKTREEWNNVTEKIH